MQVMLMRLMSKGEYLIVPKGTKFTGAGKLGLSVFMVNTTKQILRWNKGHKLFHTSILTAVALLYPI